MVFAARVTEGQSALINTPISDTWKNSKSKPIWPDLLCPDKIIWGPYTKEPMQPTPIGVTK
jgi:hypothetical protein